MVWTRRQFFIVLLMIITGSINTINMKWADTISSIGRDGVKKKFHHPFFQACCMFLGELFCLFMYIALFKFYSRLKDGTEDIKDLTKGNRDFNPLVLFLPAMCDMTSSCITYIALNLTFASSFQMFRGSVIIFVGLLSMICLKRVLGVKEWLGIFLVIIGLTLVGIADFISKGGQTDHHSSAEIITGDVLIVFSQIIAAVQFVVEEKFVAGLDIPPLQAAGWEGLFGFVTLGLLHIPFYFIRAGPPVTHNHGDRMEDVVEAFVKIGHSWQLSVAIGGAIISIAFFNFSGISVTKELSATTRMVLDSVRTIIIWIFSLAFFGQKFHWLQLIGFILLVSGMCLYNNITLSTLFSRSGNAEGDDIAQQT